MDERGPGAYVITHQPTGYFYIGSTSRLKKRWLMHLNELKRGVHPVEKMQELHNLCDGGFEVEYLPTGTREEAYSLEEQRLLISKDNSLCLNGVHWVNRITGGWSMSEEGKVKLSALWTPQRREEHRRQMQQRPVSPDGVRRSIESKQGKHRNDDTRLKLQTAGLACPPSEEQVMKLVDSVMRRRKPVKIQGVLYESVADASRKLGISEETIKVRCKNPNPTFDDWCYLDKVYVLSTSALVESLDSFMGDVSRIQLATLLLGRPVERAIPKELRARLDKAVDEVRCQAVTLGLDGKELRLHQWIGDDLSITAK